jgi:hypothetical protein
MKSGSGVIGRIDRTKDARRFGEPPKPNAGWTRQEQTVRELAPGGAPVAVNDDMRVVVQPPHIPPQMGLGRETVYGQLMKKHDRMTSRHMPNAK